MKPNPNRFIVLVGLFLSLAAPAFGADPAGCTNCLREVSSALRDVQGGLKRHEFYETTKINEEDLAAVKQLTREFGGEESESKYFVDYVDSVFRKIKTSEQDPVAAGEKMAQFGAKMDQYIAKLASREARKSADYSIADAVSTLEEFKPEEFKPAERLGWKDSGAPFVHSDDYLAYTEGYVDNKPPYSNHPWGGGLLNLTDIRDGASHNYFPLQLQPHDMRHIHYATGHPRPVAIYFKNARSHNNMRFMIQGAMYEGVDSVQFGHESALARYMALERKMDLEEAMVYIGRATKEELDKIMDGANVRSAMESGATTHATWVPTIKGDVGTTHNGKSLDQEVEDFLDRGMGYLQRPELNKYTNFRTTPTAGVDTPTQENAILFGERTSAKQNGTFSAPEVDQGTYGNEAPAQPAAEQPQRQPQSWLNRMIHGNNSQ